MNKMVTKRRRTKCLNSKAGSYKFLKCHPRENYSGFYDGVRYAPDQIDVIEAAKYVVSGKQKPWIQDRNRFSELNKGKHFYYQLNPKDLIMEIKNILDDMAKNILNSV